MASAEYDAFYAALMANPPIPRGLPIDERRATMDKLGSGLVDVEGVEVDAAELGGCAVEWVRPEDAASDRAVLYLHGGAYVIGSPRTHRRHVSHLASATGANFAVLDYRLAPEHPFPAAVDDAVAGYRALVADGIDPANIAIAGDSAGGGLTAATILAVRDRGDPLPAGGVMMSPWADLGFSGESYSSRGDADPIVFEEDLRQSADWYLNGEDPMHPLASPVHGDFTDVPPLLVSAGDREVLRDDAVMLAERARVGGAEVSSEIVPEMMHVFHAFVGLFPEADDANRRIAEFLRARLGL